jgi:NAD kinase
MSGGIAAITRRSTTCAVWPGVKVQVTDRSFLPQFTFDDGDIVVTVGPIARRHTKNIQRQPIRRSIPIEQVEGVLLPFTIEEYPRALEAALQGDVRVQQITMAEAVLSDGQRLVAFNDLFIGVRSHVSARYRISHGARAEEHSSSGIVVSTGAGSTGWLRSVYAGAAGVAEGVGTHIEPRRQRWPALAV